MARAKTRDEKLFAAAVLRRSFELRGEAESGAFRFVYDGVLRDLGLTVSVGLSHNKFLAKVASDLDKPRGFSVIGKAETVGLVGPNGAGKSTLFRLVTKEEEPDEGQVSIDRGVTIGHFSQDVGEMSGRTAVAETMDGAGPVSAVAAELRELAARIAPIRPTFRMSMTCGASASECTASSQ